MGTLMFCALLTPFVQGLAWLSGAINQLVSVEHALAMHVTSSVNDIEAHEATTKDVCAGCSFTAATFAAKNAAQ
jgi:hypothetical protein